MASRATIKAQVRRCYELRHDRMSLADIAAELGVKIGVVRSRLKEPCPADLEEKITTPVDESEEAMVRAELSTALRATVVRGQELVDLAQTERAYQDAATGLVRAATELAKLHGLHPVKGKGKEEVETIGGKVQPKVVKLMQVRV